MLIMLGCVQKSYTYRCSSKEVQIMSEQFSDMAVQGHSFEYTRVPESLLELINTWLLQGGPGIYAANTSHQLSTFVQKPLDMNLNY